MIVVSPTGECRPTVEVRHPRTQRSATAEQRVIDQIAARWLANRPQVDSGTLRTRVTTLCPVEAAELENQLNGDWRRIPSPTTFGSFHEHHHVTTLNRRAAAIPIRRGDTSGTWRYPFDTGLQRRAPNSHPDGDDGHESEADDGPHPTDTPVISWGKKLFANDVQASDVEERAGGDSIEDRLEQLLTR